MKPSKNKHFKRIETGEIFEGEIILGIYDKEENYTEVSDTEYQEYLKSLTEKKEEPTE